LVLKFALLGKQILILTVKKKLKLDLLLNLLQN